MKIDLVKLVEEVSKQEKIEGGIHKIFALTCLQKLVDMQEEAITVTHCCTEVYKLLNQLKKQNLCDDKGYELIDKYLQK